MNIMPTRVAMPQFPEQATFVLPVAVPHMSEVEALAEQLHQAGEAYEGTAWGWPVYYDPEQFEEAAEYQIPDGRGGFRVEIKPFWTPASFTIGQNGFWFYSLLWEHGRDAPPTSYTEPTTPT